MCRSHAQALGPAGAAAGLDAAALLACITLVRVRSAHQLIAVLDHLGALMDAEAQQRLEQQQRQQRQQQPGHPSQAQAAGAAQPAGVDGPCTGEAAGPHQLLIVDSVSAVLSTVLGSNQHTQGEAAAADTSRASGG